MNESKGKKWIDLLEKREKLEGIRIVRMMENLYICQYILNKNFQELSSSINYYERNPYIWNIDNRKKLDEFQKEFIRYLHNYLASTYSLIEHTRHFCKDLDNSQFDDEYKKKIEILVTNDCLKFIQDLRNYIQHYKLPLFSATLSWHATGKEKREGISEQKLVLHKEDLLKWDGWSSDSKNYMEKHGKEINLKLGIFEYLGLIIKFYNWFYKRVIDLHITDIEELTKIESEMLSLQS